MSKTVFQDSTDPTTIVTAAFLNALQNHRHNGGNVDGSCPIDYAVDAGAANAYVATYTPPITAHVIGLPLYFKAAHANTGASTFNPGCGAVAITRLDGSALQAGDIPGGGMILIAFDGTSYQLFAGLAAYLSDIAAHNASGAAHTDIRALPAAAVSAHNTSGAAHADIRALIAALSFSSIYVQDQKTQNAAAQTVTNNVWVPRDLTQIVANTIYGASLAANQIILPAGTYICHASAPALCSATGGGSGHRIALFDKTHSPNTPLCPGTSENSTYAVTRSFISGFIFTLTEEAHMEIDHFATSAFYFGSPVNQPGQNEVYAEVSFLKIG